ncbi:hypothetical protein F511_26634 [Dorcoceras hygrometricum]|uniref:Uncharacterized protein n=1 Tax=Dorcoceras hygrometricum TaxID=472368 RepID=A0A2Z7AMN0_9LAMI|nr:hypothetical protein F511_26634 [Dorcoceras hygrometricum]
MQCHACSGTIETRYQNIQRPKAGSTATRWQCRVNLGATRATPQQLRRPHPRGFGSYPDMLYGKSIVSAQPSHNNEGQTIISMRPPTLYPNGRGLLEAQHHSATLSAAPHEGRARRLAALRDGRWTSLLVARDTACWSPHDGMRVSSGVVPLVA